MTSTASTVPGPTTPAPEEEVAYYGPIDVGYQFERTTWIVEANSITSEPPRQVELSDGSATVVPFELQVSAVAFTSDLAPTYDLATPTAGRLGVVDIGPEAVGERVDSESEHFLVGLQALPDSHSLYGARYAVMFVVAGSDLESEFVGRAADEGLDRQLAALAQATGSPSLAHNVAAWQTAVAASNDGDQAQLTLLRDAVHTSPESNLEPSSVTSSSITFCDPIDPPDRRYAHVSSEVAVQISEAIWEIEERYASSPTFALAGWRTVAAPVGEIVVVFTDEDPGRNAELETLIARAVGADLAEFVEVRFERTRFSAAEIDAARSLLWARSDTFPEMPLSGGSNPQLRADGSIQDLYRISLLDLTDADRFAERYDIPPPYDIYCIEPEEQPRDEPAG